MAPGIVLFRQVRVAFVIACSISGVGALGLQKRSACKPASDNLCDPSGSGNSKDILITGSGGSGTHSVNSLFGVNGIDLCHECVGTRGSVAWPYMVNARKFYNPAEYPTAHWLMPIDEDVRFRHVFHLVRCPLDVIGAWTTHLTTSLNYVSKTMGLGDKAPCQSPCHNFDFIAKAWLAQQEFLQSFADRRFRLDEFKTMFREICRDSEFPEYVCKSDLLPERMNHRPHMKVTWALMELNPGLEEQLRAKAKEYGFDETCTGDVKPARDRNEVILPTEVVTNGLFGTDCNTTGGVETGCSDGIEWVWDRDVLQKALEKKAALQL